LLLWNEGDLSIADEYYLADYVRHHPTPSDAASLNDLKDQVIANRTLFPDYKLAFEDLIIDADRLIVFAAVTGTNTAPLEDREPTGKSIHMNGIYVFRIAEGKIAEEWTYFNLLSYYLQLGYSLAPPK
jgi:predicted ester cyclase